MENKTMNKSAIVSMIAGCALGLGALAPAAAAEQAGPDAAVAAGEIVQVKAVVEAIDLENRMVTLEDSEGNLATVPVSEAARNLDQVEIGDEVTISYLEAVAIELNKTSGAAKGVIETVTGARADKGEKPGASLAREVTMFGVIEAIDSGKSSVTLRGSKGKQVEVQVRDPERLEKLAVGDQVQITYAQAVVISVDAASD
jgi:Cu/Ag efflux protein CusF